VDVFLMVDLPPRGVEHHQQKRRRHSNADQDGQSSSKAHATTFETTFGTFQREVMSLSAPVYYVIKVRPDPAMLIAQLLNAERALRFAGP
jgi:hypothetical protein